MRREALITILLGVLLAVSLAACGTQNVGVFQAATLEDTRTVNGVTLGGFEVIRCNADGQFDPAMNPTLKLRLNESAGDKALTIGIEDSELVSNVELEVRYDTARFHATRIELDGIYGDNETVTLALADLPGKAAIGEVCVGEAPLALNGDFATVYFASGAARTVSANNGPHSNPAGVGYVVYPAGANLPNLGAESDVGSSTARLWWYGAWHIADGDQNSLVTVSDITPIGVFFGQSSETNWAAMRADYNFNTLVEVADIQPIGFYYDQGTTHYRVSASDDTDASAASPVLVKEVEWNGDELNPYSTNQGDADPGHLYPVFNWWEMEFTTSSEFSWANLVALDANDNKMVRLQITPHDENDDSATSSIDIEVAPDIVPADRLTVTSYAVEILVAGDPDTSILLDDVADAASIAANSEVAMSLDSISGSFNTEAFDGADPDNWPAEMTQTDYDTAFTACRNLLEWRIEHGGAAGFRRTADWIVFGSGETSPITGDPGAGTIFPDEDPQSDETFPEGLMQTYLPAESELVAPDQYPSSLDLEVHVISAVSYNFEVDILKDETAAELIRYGDDPDNEMTELLLNEDTFTPIQFKWGIEQPADFALTGLELHRIVNGVSVEIVETFDYIPDTEMLDPGEYQIRPMVEDWVVFCVVPGAGLTPESFYAFRIFGQGVWSSINYPEGMLGTKPPPPPQDLIVIPEHGWPAIDVLQVFYDDPAVRRNPAMWYDFETGSLLPTDEIAFNDILRTSGDEFYLQAAGALYPQVAVQKTLNPDDITSLNDPLNIVGISSADNSPGRLLIEVSLLSKPGTIDDPVEYYAFKFFNADGTAVGQGTFDMAPIGNFNTSPVGRNWGINLWDREEGALNTRTYDNFVHDGATVGSSRPDVIWFEFGGGWVFDHTQDEKGVYSSFPADFPNLLVHAQDVDAGDKYYMEMALRVVGLSATGDFLAIHTFTNLDWHWPGVSGWPGRLDTGNRYQLSLDDPHFPGFESTYPQNLIVTGQNPNEL